MNGAKIKSIFDSLFTGEFRLFKWQFPKAFVLGFFSVVLLYVGTAGIVSSTTPWYSRGDTFRHVDYVWRVYNHDIPRWYDGVQYKPFTDLTGPKKQGESANPPLFYAIHAPFVGPLLKQGKWQSAIAVGRAINILLGIGCIIVLSWAGWLLGGKRKELFAITVPAFSVLLFRFARLNMDYAIDPLFVTLSTLSLIANYKILKSGLKKKYIIWVAVLSVLGMLTKAPYMVFMFINFLAIVIASFMHSKQTTKQKLIKGTVISAIILILVCLASGWFYYFWNYKTNGNLFKSSPPGYTGGRQHKSLFDVLSSMRLWGFFYANYSPFPALSVTIASLAGSTYLRLSKKEIRKFFKDRARAVAIALVFLSALGMFMVQVKFGIGYGAINFRYMLPAILAFSLFLSYGLLGFEKTRGQVAALAIIIIAGTSVLGLSGGPRAIYRASLDNNVYSLLPIALLIMIFIGTLILSTSLFVLTKKAKK